MGGDTHRIEDLVVLPRRVKPQPTPNINPGGDCGSCCLGGLLGKEVPDVYAWLKQAERRAPFGWHEMRDALAEANGQGLVDRTMLEPPMWFEPHESQRTFGSPSWTQALEWFGYIRMGLDAGYYALAEVNYAQQGPMQAPDHWVMIVGARELWPGAGGGAIHQQVLISCSARSSPDEEWVTVREFLEKRGGFHAFLARPAAP